MGKVALGAGAPPPGITTPGAAAGRSPFAAAAVGEPYAPPRGSAFVGGDAGGYPAAPGGAIMAQLPYQQPASGGSGLLPQLPVAMDVASNPAAAPRLLSVAVAGSSSPSAAVPFLQGQPPQSPPAYDVAYPPVAQKQQQQPPAAAADDGEQLPAPTAPGASSPTGIGGNEGSPSAPPTEAGADPQ